MADNAVGTPEQQLGRSAVPTASRAAAAQILLSRVDPDLPIPARAHPGDAGVDLYARSDVTLGPGERALVGTGIAIALPEGHAAFVHPRSGLAARHGVTVLNSPGTVDAGYRGEIKVNLINHDREHSVQIARGDRIAQLVIQQVLVPGFIEVATLPGSQRGEGGHGSTGGTASGDGASRPDLTSDTTSNETKD